jgi:tetratricopeptide repeat protein 7
LLAYAVIRSQSTFTRQCFFFRRMSTILETALQRSPIVLIKAGRLQAAIERYRLMLSAIETKATQSFRLTLTR